MVTTRIVTVAMDRIFGRLISSRRARQLAKRGRVPFHSAQIMNRKSVYWACFGLLTLVAVSAALRFGYNSVLRYGNGDEYHYRLQIQTLFDRGWNQFPQLVRTHLANEPDYPAPYRWGYLAIGHLACELRHVCDERSLAWISTLSGIACVGLIAWLGARLFRPKTALVATALAVTSPLHMELGRRAYADELHTAGLLMVLVALAGVAIEPKSRRGSMARGLWVGVALLALVLVWSIKESIVFFLPALTVWIVWLRRPPRLKREDFLLLLLPPAVAIMGFAWLNHGIAPLVSLLRATRLSFLHPYSTLNQYGPPHRPLIELFTLSPWVFGLLPIVPFAAFGMAFQRPSNAEQPLNDDVSHRHAQALTLSFALIFVAFLVLPKNVRFYAVLDPLARLLVAWFVCEILPVGRTLSLGWWLAILLCHAAFELALFHRTFVTSSVTDPTSAAIFHALQMVPNDGVEKNWHPPIVVLLCSLTCVCAAWISAFLSKFSRKSLLLAAILSISALLLPQLFRPFGDVLARTSLVFSQVSGMPLSGPGSRHSPPHARC